ncbi:hypothetical protein BDK51DRAFT_16068, partial [Blyttiomyces helicus]
HIFDPVLTDLDKRLATHYGFTVIVENERGSRPITRPTLFYMPHCGLPLYSSVLRSNWSPKTLPLLAIIGNSFDAYAMHPQLHRQGPFVQRALKRVVECPFPDEFPGGISVFNNTGLHLFGDGGGGRKD